MFYMFPLICLVFRFPDKAFFFRKSKVLTDKMKPTRWRGLVLYNAVASVGISVYCCLLLPEQQYQMQQKENFETSYI